MYQKGKNNFRKKTFGKPKFHQRRSSNNGGHHSRDGFENSGSFDVRSARKAEQMRDKYLQMAKEALSTGDRVLAENFHQHADHYFRIILEAEKNGINLRTYDNNRQNNSGEKDAAPVVNGAPNIPTPASVTAPMTDAELQNVAFLRKNATLPVETRVETRPDVTPPFIEE